MNENMWLADLAEAYGDGDPAKEEFLMDLFTGLANKQKKRDWEEFRELTWKEKEEIGKVLDKETDERSRLVLLAEDTGIDIVLDMIDAKIAELRKKSDSL